MARFVMANRKSGKFSRSEKLASREAMSGVLAGPFMAGSSIVARHEPSDDTARHLVVFEAEPDEMRAGAAELPADVLVEPEIHHHHGPLSRFPVPVPAGPPAAADAPTGRELSVTVLAEPGQAPLAGAHVNLFFDGFGFSRKVSAVTDAGGGATLRFDPSLRASAVVAMPADDCWPTVVTRPGVSVTIMCAALPAPASHVAWWHGLVGLPQFRLDRGAGIRVGVVDTGAGPHPALAHVIDAGAFLDGTADSSGGGDVESHGTHICGIIGARPVREGDFGGIAAGVELYSARIFRPDGTATQLGIAHALDALSRDRGVDLVNLSLGSDRGSAIAHDAILAALERGTLCICAAGNTSGDVMYPAAFPESVAVTALGLSGWGPPNSVPAMRKSPDGRGVGEDGLFLDLLSCRGPNVSACAPGVGIISTVPARSGVESPYAAMGGSSMAAGLACGALAVLLSRSDAYGAMPRDATRARMARTLLEKSCRSVGLPRDSQGGGMPRV